MKPTPTSPDALCGRNAKSGVQITCRLMDRKSVLLEGTREGLRFLGELLIAQADVAQDCGFQIEPGGPGARLFSPDSDRGIYIHRVPCDHERDGRRLARREGARQYR